MPETKKINEVEMVVKDILEKVENLEKDKKMLLRMQEERDEWKHKYTELNKLYIKMWI
tara:strand:+ start:1381 stop:1554 length:174 start_codon:yes stop_codon:yes gene_type:complete